MMGHLLFFSTLHVKFAYNKAEALRIQGLGPWETNLFGPLNKEGKYCGTAVAKETSSDASGSMCVTRKCQLATCKHVFVVLILRLHNNFWRAHFLSVYYILSPIFTPLWSDSVGERRERPELCYAGHRELRRCGKTI